MTQPDSSTGGTPKRYYLAYGAALHPKLLAARLGPTKPLSSHTVLVPTAFLSFDMRGLPYLEPCFTSAIVEGVNDLGWSGLGGKEGEGEQLTKEEKEGNEGYRKWVWERCCPGLEFTGELPPRLEGVAYELSESHWQSVMNFSPSSTSTDDPPRLSSSTAARAYKVVPVKCVVFEKGDSSKEIGTLMADMPIVVEEEARAAGLQPTTKYLRLVLIGAFFSTLSQPYLGHLSLLRPYQPTTLLKSATSYLFTFLLLPPFLLIHLPTMLAKRIFGASVGWGRLGRWAERRSWGFLRGAERVLRGVMGSGYRNEGEGEGEVWSRGGKKVKGE